MDAQGKSLESDEVSMEELERLANAMVRAIPDLDCPECCDCGWRYQFMEKSAQWYQEEWEWACLANTLIYYRHKKMLRS